MTQPPPNLNLASIKSLDVVYDQTTRTTDLQLSHADAIDAKAGILFTAASFVISGVAGVQVALSGHLKNPDAIGTFHALAYLALFAYGGVVVCSFRAFLMRDYKSAPDPRLLYQRHATVDPRFTKLMVIQELLKSYNKNDAELKDKQRWLLLALVSVLLEAVILGIILFVIALTL